MSPPAQEVSPSVGLGEATTAAAGSSRLTIHKIVIENFKSYAGRQEIGPFHKRFSSIVGPNGSGKSNVIDALQFVFTRRANKMRLKKMSELIHKSENHPNLKQASVSVEFVEVVDKDNDEIEILPGTELVVKRTCDINNESNYYVNEKKSSATAVANLLKEKHIDLDNNRFLILQGEVEQIATMKPKGENGKDDGLLEYLEDIIGSNKYVEAIKEEEKKVEEANEIRSAKLNRVKHAEKEKDGLEAPRNEALEWIKKDIEYHRERHIVHQIWAAETTRDHARLVDAASELKERLSHEQEKLQAKNEEMSNFESTYKEHADEYSAIEKQMNKSKEEFSSFERKDVKYREDLKHLKTREKKLKDSLAKEEKKGPENELAIKKAEANITRNENELKTLTARKTEEDAKLEKIYDSIKDEVAGVRGELEEKEKELGPWKKEVNDAKSNVDVVSEELSLLKARATEAEKQMQEAKDAVDTAKKTIVQRREEIKQCGKEKQDAVVTLDKAKSRREVLVKEEKALAESTRSARAKMEEAKVAMSQNKSRSAVLGSIMEASRKGLLKGVYGRLGDLGTIDDKYDIAVTTACPQLDNIVVDCTATGQKCVEFLRDNKLGRASFILLDKIQNVREAMNASFSHAKGQRLFDLITPKEEIFRPAFYFALRNTLVCDTIDTAQKVAYGAQRFRVVTLDGALIDVSGTMSGGGNRVQKGGMRGSVGEPVSEKELKSIETDADKKMTQLKATRDEIRTLTETIERLEKRLAGIDTDVSKMELDITAMETQMSDAEARMQEVKEKTKLTKEEQAKVNELEGMLSLHQKALAKAEKNASQVEEEVKAIQAKIANAGGEPLRRQKARVEELGKKIDAISTEMNKDQVQITQSRKAIDKASAQVKKLESELVDLAAEAEKTKSEFKAIEEDAMAVMQEYERTKGLLTAKSKEMKEVQANFDALKKEVSRVRNVEVEIQNKLDDYNDAINQASLKAKDAKAKIISSEEKIASHLELFKDDDEMMAEMNAGKKANKSKAENDDADSDEEDDQESEDGIFAPVRRYEDEELLEMDKKKHVLKMTTLEESRGPQPSTGPIADFNQKLREYKEKVAELDEATEIRDAARKAHDALRSKRATEFLTGFNTISMKLKEMYQMITLGGDAELELVDSLDPFSEGVLFSVRPPKKSWKNITNLSGGEKTLSSLSLVFALHHYKPTPLYFMDEIDAALDFKNVSIVANYIKERTKNAQFIIISLRNNMFELADRLVGIYKTNNATKSVSINPTAISVQPVA